MYLEPCHVRKKKKLSYCKERSARAYWFLGLTSGFQQPGRNTAACTNDERLPRTETHQRNVICHFKHLGHWELLSSGAFPLKRCFLTDKANPVRPVLPEMASYTTIAHVLCLLCCAQYPGNPHHSQLELGPLLEVRLDVHLSLEWPVSKGIIHVTKVD